MKLRIERIYGSKPVLDEFRVLVDRVWPRGISKETAALDEWAKDVAPSADLRKWFAHKPERFLEFKKRYQLELSENKAVNELIGKLQSHPKVVLLYGAKDETHNQATVLVDYLGSKLDTH